MPSIHIQQTSRTYRFPAAPLRRLVRHLLGCAAEFRPGVAVDELSVLLTDDAGIAPVNERFVGHEGPTDVISFLYAGVPGAPATGELVVNAQRAHEEAARRHIRPEQELAFYLAHGILHLAGEDDATPAARARMHRIQRRWLAVRSSPRGRNPGPARRGPSSSKAGRARIPRNGAA